MAGGNQLVRRVLWEDVDLVELEVSVTAKGWQGKATAYADPDALPAFVEELRRFGTTLRGQAALEAGNPTDDALGFVALRFYRLDVRGYLACHVTLKTGATHASARPEEVSRLSLDVRAEPAAFDAFVGELESALHVRRPPVPVSELPWPPTPRAATLRLTSVD